MNFGISDKQVKEFYQKEYDEKHTPFSIVALAALNNDPISLEEITAMRAILKQDSMIKPDDIWYSILDDFEKIIKEKKEADQPSINTLSKMG